ncbi:hypothetical protein D3C86_1622640 [compost metagenome]
MSVADLVEDVRVPASHVGDDEVGGFDLAVDSFQDRLREALLVHALRNYVQGRCDLFDPQLVDVIELGAEWHQDEGE